MIEQRKYLQISRQTIEMVSSKTINTERIVLRPLVESDVNEVFYLRSDEVVGQYIKREKLKDTDGAMLFIHRIIREVFENKIHYWAISRLEDSKMIGSICLWNFNEEKSKAEVGYDLHPGFQGQGIMNETLSTVLNFAFKSLELTEVSAYTDKRNLQSISLLIRNGFLLNESIKDEGNLNNRVFIVKNS